MGDTTHDDEVRQLVRERYAASARAHLPRADQPDAGCCEASGASAPLSGCCQSAAAGTPAVTPAARCCTTPSVTDPISRDLYDPDTPFDSALAASLGCGNPTALAELNPGDDVLDLGSGGGLDVLLSARRVAPDGMAYGLDMTPEMLDLARRNQAEAGVQNATFLHGTIEQVPLPDTSVDVIISNCVINLSPNKDAVLREAFRVLRPGGRFAVSDIVLLREIPEALTAVAGLWTGCISGAIRDAAYLEKLAAAGFVGADIEVTRRYDRAELVFMASQLASDQLPDGMTLDQAVDGLDGAFAGAFIRATKPATESRA